MRYIVLALFLLGVSSTASADLNHGKELYTKLCVSCHGAEGKGDGPIGAALPADQKPRNFVDGTFKVSTDDAKMKDVIKKGGMAFGLSALMAPQPSLSDTDLDDLVAVIRSFKK